MNKPLMIAAALLLCNSAVFAADAPAAPAPAAAPSPAAAQGATLYATPAKGGCVACHGKDAKTPLLPVYPKLAGQNKDYLIQQMKDIKSGTRSNGQTAAMKGVMHMVNDEEMAAIAEWLSTLR
jgi:cytochrome c